MPGMMQNRQQALQGAMYGGMDPWSNPSLGMAAFKQQHPGVMNILRQQGEGSMYWDPAVQQHIAQQYNETLPMGLMPGMNQQRGFFGGLGFDDMPFLEQLLDIRKKRKKKAQ